MAGTTKVTTLLFSAIGIIPLSEFGTMKAQGCFACWASGSRNDLVRDLMPIPVAVPEGQSPYSETKLSA